MKPSICVVGYFPPPITGQAMATEHLSNLLGSAVRVKRVPVNDKRVKVQVSMRQKLGTALGYLGAIPRLKKTIGGGNFSSVIWTSVSPTPLGHARDLLTALPALQSTQHVYGVVHWGNFDRVFRSPVTRFTARHLVKRLDGFIFNNYLLASKCARWIPEYKRFIIPNTVDQDILCSSDEVDDYRRRRVQRKKSRLLFLSNMIRSKGYLDVLESVHCLKKDGQLVQADFVGAWPSEKQRTEFERAVETLDVHELVHHHGPISDRRRLKEMYLMADVFVLPTYYPTEAQPHTIIEALNAGTPVITTRQGGIPKMVREDIDSLFVPPREPDAIADAVVQLCTSDRWPQFSVSARKRFEEMFSPEMIRKQWLELLAPHLSVDDISTPAGQSDENGSPHSRRSTGRIG